MAGATARQMLEAAAAQTSNVAVGECQAQSGFVAHGLSGRKLAFGDLAKVAALLPVPRSSEVRLKERKDWRYIGKPHAIVDLKDIVRGRASYGIDVVVPGMKYASIERCPVYGGRVKSFDPKDALSVRGVERIVEIPATPMPSGFKPLGGIAVIANNTWSAQQGRQRLKIEWDYGPNAGHDSPAYRAELEATAREPGKVVRNHGDVDGALSSAAKRVSADYFVPHLAHAQMEVPTAVARWVADTCETWSPTQNPTQVRETVAEVLGVNQSDVTVSVTLLGGGFGRKSKPDYVAEAALLSRMVGAPIKVPGPARTTFSTTIITRSARSTSKQRSTVTAAPMRGCIEPCSQRSRRHSSRISFTAAAASWVKASSTCPTTFPTCAVRMAPRRTTCGSAGIARSTTSRTLLRSARLSTNLQLRRARTLLTICGSCSSRRASSI